jgi:hypothetical protein
MRTLLAMLSAVCLLTPAVSMAGEAPTGAEAEAPPKAKGKGKKPKASDVKHPEEAKEPGEAKK